VLQFGVVIPTKNSMKYLPGHVANLQAWIDLAEQVVVVDSFSTDGSVAYLKEKLRHPDISFVQHPPGLYASWNFGIGHVRSEFCYISTVGDSITRAGLDHFVATAARLNCDVLVSRPEFVDEAGQPCAGPTWPMDEVIGRLKLNEPARLPSAIVVATALTHTGGALTGSCASDLFRTEVLQKNPFPLAFGAAGDGAWSLQHASCLTWAVTPEKFTTFRLHPPTASASEVEVGKTADNFAPLTRTIILDWLESNAHDASVEERDDIRRLLALTTELAALRERCHCLRKAKWPWILNPSAWTARSRRNQLKSRFDCLMEKIYALK
jgi:hypothetical protein